MPHSRKCHKTSHHCWTLSGCIAGCGKFVNDLRKRKQSKITRPLPLRHPNHPVHCILSKTHLACIAFCYYFSCHYACTTHDTTHQSRPATRATFDRRSPPGRPRERCLRHPQSTIPPPIFHPRSRIHPASLHRSEYLNRSHRPPTAKQSPPRHNLLPPPQICLPQKLRDRARHRL